MGGVLDSISVDVCEKGDSYELHASLPGVPKESVKVTSNPSCPHASAFSPSDKVWSAVETSVGFAQISLTLIMTWYAEAMVLCRAQHARVWLAPS